MTSHQRVYPSETCITTAFSIFPSSCFFQEDTVSEKSILSMLCRNVIGKTVWRFYWLGLIVLFKLCHWSREIKSNMLWEKSERKQPYTTVWSLLFLQYAKQCCFYLDISWLEHVYSKAAFIGAKCPELTAEESLWESNVKEQKLNGPYRHVVVVLCIQFV